MGSLVIYLNAISYYLPKKTLDNETIIKDFFHYGGSREGEITSESLYSKCGINNRFVADLEETSKDLGNKAAEKLFEEWDIAKSTIDYLIFVRDASDYKGPNTSCIMQHNLGLPQTVAAIDIQHGCSGWVYGLSISKALITAGMAKRVLLITADVPTRIIHPEDIDIRSIFSDGAAASLISGEILENGINSAIGDFIFGTDGAGEKVLYTERSSVRHPADIAYLKKYEHLPSKLEAGRLRMDSAKIFLFAFRCVPKLITELLEKHKMQMDDIDLFIFHQANGAMLEFLRKRIKIPEDKFINNVENIGNTIGSTIPIAMKQSVDNNKIKPGNRIMVLGFGIGFSWGGTILTKQLNQ